MPDVRPQLYTDNRKCTAECPDALFDAARFTSRYVRSVGQDVSPGKCVLLGTSEVVRQGHEALEMSLGMARLGRSTLMFVI